MGKLQKLPGKIIIRMTPEEILTDRFATSKDVFCTMAMYVRKIAELKAQKLGVVLPLGVGSTTFDRSTGEYLVTFAETVEQIL